MRFHRFLRLFLWVVGTRRFISSMSTIVFMYHIRGGVQGRRQMKASIPSAAIAADLQQIPRLPSYTTCRVCHLHTFTKRDG